MTTCRREKVGMRPPQEAGAVVTEFLLVFGLVVFLLLGVFEFGRMLRLKQMISQLSRDAAYRAFKECVPRPTWEVESIQGCINLIHQDVTAAAASISLPTADIIVAVYEQNGLGTTQRLASFPAEDTSGNLQGPVLGHPTVFTLASFQSGGQFNTIITQQRKVATAEVVFDYQPLFGYYLFPGSTWATLFVLADRTIL